jgi:hypothetical protein
LARKISGLEQEVYNYIKDHGEVIVSDVPKNMRGAIPNLKNAGLVVTFRKPVTPWATKKKTFVKALKKK